MGMKRPSKHAVSVTSVHPTWRKTRPDDPNDTHAGWAFAHPGEVFSNPAGVGSFPADDACAKIPPPGIVSPGTQTTVGAATGTRFTVPILYDKKRNTIVSNESSEIIRDLNSMFDEFATNPGLDLYPERLRPEIDEINEWVYRGVNDGVYKSGFATSQAAYEEAVTELFRCMDRVEEILSTRRYIAGDVVTEAQRLFAYACAPDAGARRVLQVQQEVRARVPQHLGVRAGYLPDPGRATERQHVAHQDALFHVASGAQRQRGRPGPSGILDATTEETGRIRDATTRDSRAAVEMPTRPSSRNASPV